MFKPLDYREEDVGGVIKQYDPFTFFRTTRRYAWYFEVDEKQYIIEVFHTLTGRVRIAFNGKDIYNQNKLLDPGVLLNLTIGLYPVSIMSHGSGYELRIDGEVFSHTFTQSKMRNEFGLPVQEEKKVAQPEPTNKSPYSNQTRKTPFDSDDIWKDQGTRSPGDASRQNKRIFDGEPVDYASNTLNNFDPLKPKFDEHFAAFDNPKPSSYNNTSQRTSASKPEPKEWTPWEGVKSGDKPKPPTSNVDLLGTDNTTTTTTTTKKYNPFESNDYPPQNTAKPKNPFESEFFSPTGKQQTNQQVDLLNIDAPRPPQRLTPFDMM